MKMQPSNLLPALRAKMGDWWYYVTTMTLAEVDKWVKPVDAIHERAELKTWIQRILRPERTEQIANYLLSQPQRFFNAIVVGIYGGEPRWFPVEVGESPVHPEIAVGKRQATAFGLLLLSGEEEIFAIDGQHRVEGIREALKRNVELGKEEQCVIFVAHKTTDQGRERTRRLFTTLNKYAKSVSQSEIVALSEDDVFAMVTRRLIDEYPGLGSEFVPRLPTANIPPYEKKCMTTVVGLYDLTIALAPPDVRRERKRHQTGPAKAQVVEGVYRESEQFWNALKQHIGPVRNVCASDPKEELATKYRNPEGGHLLFRTVGLKAFAKASRVLMDRGDTADRAVGRLAKVPLELEVPLWREVVWRPQTRTVLHKYGRLALNILLHEVGAKPDSKKYSLVSEYKRITGRDYPRH